MIFHKLYSNIYITFTFDFSAELFGRNTLLNSSYSLWKTMKSFSMNQLVETFPNFSLARSYYEDMGNSILSMTSKYGEDARAATLYVILGCLCLWYVKRYWRSKRSSRSPSPDLITKSRFLGELYGGALALQRLLEDYYKAQVNPATLDNTESLLKALLEEEHLDLMKLQSTVMKLEMSGREGNAVQILERAKKAHAGKPHQAYEIEMLLVEMLIFKGDWKCALKCECLKHEEIADARRPLYKAILHKLLGKTKEAKDCWEEFIDIRRQMKDPTSFDEGSHETITDFEMFENEVDELRSAIKNKKKFAGRN